MEGSLGGVVRLVSLKATDQVLRLQAASKRCYQKGGRDWDLMG